MGSHCTSEVRQRKVKNGENISARSRERESIASGRSLSESSGAPKKLSQRTRTPSTTRRKSSELAVTSLSGINALPTATIRIKLHRQASSRSEGGASESNDGKSAESLSAPAKDGKGRQLSRRGKKNSDGPTRLNGSDFRSTVVCDDGKVEDWLLRHNPQSSAPLQYRSTANHSAELHPMSSRWYDEKGSHCYHDLNSSGVCCDVRSLKSLSQKRDVDDDAAVNSSFASSFSRASTGGGPVTPFTLPLFNAKH